ncbi:helix-turn-helix domain-containing protein [Vibrio scophthalmi]|nr:helix-turn-helix domain-containing protein [Vibrio scophthalmi]
MSKTTEINECQEDGMLSFPERLKELIENDSLKDFASAIGISEGGLRKYLPPARSVPSFDKVVRIANYRKVNLAWLATGEGQKYVSESNSTEFIEGEFELIDGYHSEIEQLTGTNEPGEIRRRLAFRRKWLKWRGLDSKHLKVFFVKGSLEGGLINSGDTVMIDFSDQTISDGAFALKLNDATVIRWLVIKVDGGIDVYIDKNGAPIETIGEQDMMKLNILGRAVWVGKDLI